MGLEVAEGAGERVGGEEAAEAGRVVAGESVVEASVVGSGGCFRVAFIARELVAGRARGGLQALTSARW